MCLQSKCQKKCKKNLKNLFTNQKKSAIIKPDKEDKMKLKADITEYLGKNAVVARKDEIVPLKTTNVQFDKGLEK